MRQRTVLLLIVGVLLAGGSVLLAGSLDDGSRAVPVAADPNRPDPEREARLRGTGERRAVQPPAGSPESAPRERRVRERRIRGRLVDASRRPVAGTHVSVEWVTSPGRRLGGQRALTDAAGLFETRVRRRYQEFTIHASATGIGTVDRGPFPVGAGEEDLVLGDLVLHGDGVLAGRALFPDGSPAVGVDVRCSRDAGSSERTRRPGLGTGTARTDAGGRFRLAGLKPGRYGVSMVPPKYGGRPWPVESTTATTGDEDVRVVVTYPRVRLLVRDQDDDPVDGCRYRARFPTRISASLAVGVMHGLDGSASVWGRPGETLRVGVCARRHRPQEAEVFLPPGLWDRELTLVVRPYEAAEFGTIRVRAAFADGEAAGGLSVSLRTPLANLRAAEYSYMSQSAAECLPPLPAGRWRLRVAPHQEPTLRSERSWIPVVRDLVVEPGVQDVVDVTVEAGGRLNLRVKAEGDPRGRSPIRARLEPTGPRGTASSPGMGSGVLRSFRLATGKWDLTIEAEGYRKDVRSITIEEGATLRLEVDLEAN